MSTQQDGIDPRELEHPSMPTKTNGITRRDFLMSGAMVAGGLSLAHLLAACGATPAPTAVPATAGPATAVPSAGLSGIVQMWEPDTRDDAVAASQWWYDAFHQANPGVTVNDLIVPYGDDVTKLKAASDAGTAPDIMWVYGDLHFSLGADGLTRPVNDLLARIGIDRYSAGVKDGIRLNDTYYSVPFVGFPFFVYYRKDIYEQKGLKPPETLDQMLANIQACNDPPTTYGYGLTNKDISDTWNLKTAMWTHGAYFFDADDNLALDRQETLDAWAYYKELGKVSPPGSMSQSDVEMRQLMIDGSIAHHFSTTSFSASFEEADIARLGAFLYPINPGGKGASLDFFGLPITTKAPSPDLAEELIAFLLEPANFQEYLLRCVVGWVPMLEDAWTDAYLNSPRIAPIKEYLAIGAEAQKQGVVGTGYFGPSAKASVLVATDIEKQIGDRLVTLDQSPEEVLTWAVAELEAEM